MERRSPVLLFVPVVVLVAVLAPTRAASQSTGTYVPPRTPDGHPDVQGFWQVLNTAAWDIQDHHAQLAVPAGKGVVEGNDIPYLPATLLKKRSNFENRHTLDPETKCFLPGVPRITYMPFPFQIVQSRDQVTILYEYLHTIRYIYLRGEHPAGPIEWWMGDSRGRWEGNTLVVDVVHFNGDTWFDRAGNHHSEALHVIERYTPLGPDHLAYEATIEDPQVFTRPWKMTMTLYRRKDPGMELLEYECYAYKFEAEWKK